MEGNRTQQVRTYFLEPFLSGEYVIPTMEFTAINKSGEGGEGMGRHLLQTGEMRVVVKSLLDGTGDKAQEIHEIEPPVSLEEPSNGLYWWGAVGGGMLVFALLVLSVLLIRRFWNQPVREVEERSIPRARTGASAARIPLS